MNSRFIFLLFLIFTSLTLVFSNSLKYEINTSYPNSVPYYIGTYINDLKISFLDNSNTILNNDNIQSLDVKLGNYKTQLKKENDNSYHLRNFFITKDLVIDNKFVVQIVSLLEGQYTNTKQTYTLNNIQDIFKIKNNPETDYKNLTIGENINFEIYFDDIISQKISNLNCSLDSYNSDNKFSCTKNNCYFNLIVEDKNYSIACTFDKTINNIKKTYPLFFEIKPEISEGIVLGEIINPNKGYIENPFEVCFNLLYKSGHKVTNLENISFSINNSQKDVYLRNDYLCYSKFLIPFTSLNENLEVNYYNSQYFFEIKQDLSSGIYWNIFFIILALIIIINIILILRVVLSKETIESLTEQRDNYKSKLKDIKESYLQGNTTKKDFDLKLNEYSIKISYLNERILTLKKKSNVNSPNEDIKIMPKSMENQMPKKTNKELLNIINDVDNDDSNKDELIAVDTKDIDFTKISDDIESTTIANKEKPKNKFIEFFKDLFKRKPKQDKPKNYEINEDIVASKEDEKQAFQGYDVQDEFDIKKWQK